MCQLPTFSNDEPLMKYDFATGAGNALVIFAIAQGACASISSCRENRLVLSDLDH
jgi:hypothetical protein